MKKIKTIKPINICYFFFFLYLIAMTTYQLGTGFDAIFVRLSFVIFFVFTFLLNKTLKVELNGLIKWSILFWSFYFLSLIWAHNKSDTIYMFNHCMQIIGMFICIPIILKKNNNGIDTILKLIIISLLYSSIVLLIRTPLNLWGTDYIGEVIGLQRNVVGLRLSIGFLICLYFIHSKIKVEKRLNFKIIILIMIAIFFMIIALLTGSKKALIFIFLGFVLYEIFITKGLKLLIKIIIIALLSSAFINVIFNNDLLYQAIGSRVEHMILTIQGNDGKGETDGSLLERQYYINQAKELFIMHPVVGYGGNNFVSYMREIGYSHVAYSHNNYWELLSTLGSIGFLIYYYIWFKVLIGLIRDYKITKSIRTLLFLIIIAVLIILDYGNVSYISEFNMILLLLAYISIYKKKNRKIEVIYEKNINNL